MKILMPSMLAISLVWVIGCVTPPPPPADTSKPPTGTLSLMPGEQIEITFLGAPELNSIQRIRRDGRISLPLLDDVTAAGKSVDYLKAVLAQLYAPHLRIGEITIFVRSQSPVFVSGEVRSPGRLEMQRVMTALDAIMEAGGYNPDTANLRQVVVIRQTDAGRREYRLNIQSILTGQGGNSFYLQPNDIVHVPKRIPWF